MPVRYLTEFAQKIAGALAPGIAHVKDIRLFLLSEQHRLPEAPKDPGQGSECISCI